MRTSTRVPRLTRLGLVLLLAAAPIAGATVLPVAQAQGGSSVEQTKDITNYGKGTTQRATVRVSETKNLFDRQQVEVDLSGFTPTWNANNTAAGGTRMEYPVVVMQCRGADPDQTTCLNMERGRWEAGFDANASPEDRAVAVNQSGPNDTGPYPSGPENDVYDKFANFYRASRLPFVAANGISYLWVVANLRPDGSPLIDEPELKANPPTDVTNEATSNTRVIPIAPDTTNEFLFEVRQNATQPSLGCTDRQACSIVVVPIMDMACVEPLPEKGAGCESGPNGPRPGELGQTDANNTFVSSQQWRAESNWRNRFVVPISFAPDLSTCDIRGSRAELPAFGSELVSVAQERWGAAYCAGARRTDYLPRYSVGSEYFARRQITTKLGADYQQDAVFVTQPVTGSPRPIAHAPTAVTGFAVAFAVDDGNGKQVQNMTLSPRLLAKLITQSYNPNPLTAADMKGKRPYDGTQKITDDATAAKYYVAHPALVHNPRSLFNDPEFADLNPDFVLRSATDEVASHLIGTVSPMLFTIDSDVVMDVTRYVTSDPVARAWLDGQPDPYGMRVNPAWLGMRPTQVYALADSWVRPAQPRRPTWTPENPQTFFVTGAGNVCDELYPSPMLTKLANVASSAKGTAQMLLDRRGSSTPICARSTVGTETVYSDAREDPRDFGRRAQLALTTVPLARLYRLPMAKLVNAGGKAVAPTDGSMLNALHVATVDQENGTIQLDHTKITGNGWYPGTMVSYLAVPTSGLNRQVAARYADYIEFMATTGQVPGQTLSSLPPGYDPLPRALVNQAMAAAAAVRAQRGEVPPPPGDVLGDGLPPGYDGAPAQAADNPGSGLPVTARGSDENPERSGDPEQVAKTATDSSWLARWAIPLLLGFGLLAGAVAFFIQVGSRPDHPLRRRLDSVLRAVGRR